mgnify:CR=1 FL=1
MKYYIYFILFFYQHDVNDYKIIKKQFVDSLKTECMRNEQGKLSCKCGSPSIFPNFVLYINSDPFVIILKDLIERHFRYTGSERAKAVLADWENARTRFVKVMPKDFRRALTQRNAKPEAKIVAAE